MKKVLLGTSALALVGAYTGPANAAEFEVKVGGYFEAYAAYASSDVSNVQGEDHDGFDAKRDAEIRFQPSITLDNGIRIGADIQLEAAANTDTGTGDVIDEAFLFVRGSFGEVLIGSENSARYSMHYAAPDVTFVNVNSGSLTAFVPFSGTAGANSIGGPVNVGDDVFRRTLGATFIENDGNNDAERFQYFTPRFAGVQLGVSYARDPDQDSNVQQDINGEALANIVDFGVNYVQSFGPVDIAVAGGYGIAFGDANKNPQVWNAGLNVGFFGVTIGGSFAEQNNSDGKEFIGSDTEDGQAWDVGVSYETGPWGVSFTYFRGENVDDENSANPLGNDETLDQFLLGVNYKLAKGVDLSAFGAYVDFDEDTSDDGTRGGDDVDGFVIGTGIRIRF